jgi:hypothetical protein
MRRNYCNPLFTILLIFGVGMSPLTLAGPAWKKIQIRYELTGIFDHKNLQTGDIYYKFFGGVFVSATANIETGEVKQEHGPLLGIISDWRLRFDLRNNMFSNLDTRVSCANSCEILMNDGGVLQLLSDNPKTYRKETHIPMQVRFMPELGEVPNSGMLSASDPDNNYSHHIRSLGCMGFKEVAGRGYLANATGAMCINGTFTFPQSIRDAPIEDMEIIKAQSNATIVMHNN